MLQQLGCWLLGIIIVITTSWASHATFLVLIFPCLLPFPFADTCSTCSIRCFASVVPLPQETNFSSSLLFPLLEEHAPVWRRCLRCTFLGRRTLSDHNSRANTTAGRRIYFVHILACSWRSAVGTNTLFTPKTRGRLSTRSKWSFAPACLRQTTEHFTCVLVGVCCRFFALQFSDLTPAAFGCACLSNHKCAKY